MGEVRRYAYAYTYIAYKHMHICTQYLSEIFFVEYNVRG